jgi:hypothetical protein
MAQSHQNILTHGLRGQMGKQLVFKQYGKKTVVSRYPDMSNVTPSSLQKERRSRFKDAVAYAQGINNDPVLKAIYKKKVKKGQTVYHFAIKEYLQDVARV